MHGTVLGCPGRQCTGLLAEDIHHLITVLLGCHIVQMQYLCDHVGQFVNVAMPHYCQLPGRYMKDTLKQPDCEGNLGLGSTSPQVRRQRL